MTSRDTDPNFSTHCGQCGAPRHLYQSECPMFLHESVFMTGCAACGEEIPSGADRVGGKFGNIYCSTDCLATGYEQLFEEIGVGGSDKEVPSAA